MDSQQKIAEIARLAALISDGQITEAEVAILDRLLLDDPDAQAYYRQYRALDVALEWSFTDRAFQPSPLENEASEVPPQSPVLGFFGDVGRQGWDFVSNHALLFSLLAVLALAGGFVGGALWNCGWGRQNPVAQSEISDSRVASAPQEAGPRSSTPIAWLVRAGHCRWNGRSPAPELNGTLVAGQSLHLASGVAEISFDIGAKVILQGPASCQLVSAGSIRLGMGKATVEIQNPAARGFQILTPEAVFVDQGTEFGVEVAPGGSSKVHVFQGLVDVDLKGRATPAPCRLQANYGARLEQGTETMTLVEDTGECFIRTMDDADRDQHVAAYWRFEDRPVGTLLPHTEHNSKPVRATVDSSFNGNDLYAFSSDNQPSFSADVPAPTVPQGGVANRSCLDVSQPVQASIRRNVSTQSAFSHAAPLDVQKIAPAQWTIEISVKAAKLSAKPQGFLGRDGTCTLEPLSQRIPARLIFQIDSQNHFAISFYDATDRLHEAVAKDLAVQPGQWYHLAATSDGRALRLFVDASDGRGYRQRAECELPTTGSTALGKGKDDAGWSIGRAGNTSGNWLRFEGWIDEVRISDIARTPAEFLFAPRDQREDTDGETPGNEAMTREN